MSDQTNEKYGLDFGTSNSSIAIFHNGIVNVLPIDQSSSNPGVVSSVLYIDINKQSNIGSEAINLFIEKNTGRTIIRRRVSSEKIINTAFGEEAIQFDADVDIHGRFFQAIKTSLQNVDYGGTNVFEKFYTIEELTAEFLRQMKIKADEMLGRSIGGVVLGRPVYFSKDPNLDELAQKRLHDAAFLAGFKDIAFVFEPIGAALNYEAELAQEEIALVFDFGGGTLDFSVIRLGPEQANKPEREGDILAVNGIVIGGNTFDEDIMEKQLMKYFGANYSGKTLTGNETRIPNWILNQIRSWYMIPLLNERDTIRFLKELKAIAMRGSDEISALLTLIQKNYGWNLFEEIEKVKLALTYDIETQISFHKEDIHIEELLTRFWFETLIAHHLRAIDEGIDETIKLAGLTPIDIDVVICTGGSSLIPAVQSILESKFGDHKVNRQDVFTSVVKGLAVAGISKFN